MLSTEEKLSNFKMKNIVKNEADLTSLQPSNFENLINILINDRGAHPNVICPIKESLRHSLLSVASKLLSREHCQLADLSIEEQGLWNSFDNTKIYEFLTGESDTILEFQFNWIQPEAPAYRFPASCQQFHRAPAQQPQPPQPAPMAAQT